MYNRGQFMYPSEKHGIVKVIGFSIFLLDGSDFNINKMDGKKLNLAKIDKIFKVVAIKIFVFEQEKLCIKFCALGAGSGAIVW